MDKKIRFNILAIFAIILFTISICPVELQNDTFYTIKIGEYISQNGLDMKDHFSWNENLPYTYPHWLYDLGIYQIYNNFGLLGIFLSTIILACILAIMIYITNTKLTKNNLISFILTICAMYLLKPYIAARAQLVTFILFVITVYFIEKFLENKKKRYAIGLVIIPILIANLHVAVWPFYFILYLPYIAEYLICVILDLNIIQNVNKELYIIKRKISKKSDKIEVLNKKIDEINNKILKIEEKRKENRENPYKIIIKRNSNTKLLILIFLLCAFTGLITPIGKVPYTYLYDTMQGNTTQNINEHLPLVLINSKEILFTIGIILSILIFTDTKIKLSDLLMITGLITLSLTSKRQISMLVIIGILILNRLITYFLNKYDPKILQKALIFFSKIFGRLIILSIIGILMYYNIKPKVEAQAKYINDTTYPVEACTYILENLNTKNIKIYNEYNYGSYMIFRGIPVFIDSRADLYTKEFNGNKDIFSDFLNISNIGVYYENKFEEYKITHVIIYKNAKLNLFLKRDSRYNKLYEDNNFVIYERLKKN